VVHGLHLHSSHFILPFDAFSSEQKQNREKWRLIIQEAKLTLSCSAGVKEGRLKEDCAS
jgi:hypothetical protein